jgi:hypothetical protein
VVTIPRENITGFTSILLKLSRDYDTTELIREIRTLDPRLLIFLQELRRIHITIIEDDNKPWQTSLQRHDEPRGRLVTLHQGLNQLSYRIFCQLVKNLPGDPKRVGLTQSGLLLAFPADATNRPTIESQKVYAFLPIRNYGFKVGSILSLRRYNNSHILVSTSK